MKKIFVVFFLCFALGISAFASSSSIEKGKQMFEQSLSMQRVMAEDELRNAVKTGKWGNLDSQYVITGYDLSQCMIFQEFDLSEQFINKVMSFKFEDFIMRAYGFTAQVDLAGGLKGQVSANFPDKITPVFSPLEGRVQKTFDPKLLEERIKQSFGAEGLEEFTTITNKATGDKFAHIVTVKGEYVAVLPVTPDNDNPPVPIYKKETVDKWILNQSKTWPVKDTAPLLYLSGTASRPSDPVTPPVSTQLPLWVWLVAIAAIIATAVGVHYYRLKGRKNKVA